MYWEIKRRWLLFAISKYGTTQDEHSLSDRSGFAGISNWEVTTVQVCRAQENHLKAARINCTVGINIWMKHCFKSSNSNCQLNKVGTRVTNEFCNCAIFTMQYQYCIKEQMLCICSMPNLNHR